MCVESWAEGGCEGLSRLRGGVNPRNPDVGLGLESPPWLFPSEVRARVRMGMLRAPHASPRVSNPVGSRHTCDVVHRFQPGSRLDFGMESPCKANQK